jgi:acetolactate synthase-1/2/3 large subunit
MNGARLTIEALRREGVKYVFGLPGTTIMPLLDELYGHDQIRFISVRHEQTASFMADGYSRAARDGDLGVCLASRGPGAANMAIGLHNAYAESIPVLALIGQVSGDIFHREAFEEMDLVTFFQPVTKWSLEIQRVERIPELVQRAVRTAREGRPRPVMVSIPFDLLSQETENAPFYRKFRSRPPVPTEEDLWSALRLLEEARSPVMLVGGGSRGASDELVRLAEALRIPVVTTWLRKDLFPNHHPLYGGTLGYGAFEASERLISGADVLFTVGCRFSEFTTKKWTLISGGTRIIQLDIDPEEIGKIYIPEIGLQGDAAQTLRAMGQLLPRLKVDEGRLREREEANRRWTEELAEQSALDAASAYGSAAGASGLVSSLDLVRALQDVVDELRPVLVMDVPTFGVWAQRYLRINRPDSYFGCGAGSMGWGLPAAMGIKLARPEELVISVNGDGSFWMVAQDLETAVRENIPVINLVINNFAYGNTRDRQKNQFGGRYIGVFYENPDFAAFARLLGAYGERIESADQLLPAIRRAIRSGKPAVLDIIQDRFEGLPPGLAPLGTAAKA